MVDSIGVTQAAIASAPVLSTPPSQNLTPVTTGSSAPIQTGVTDQVNISSQAAQQSGQPKVQYANPEVLGTQAVTMYMVNGQLYTRYRDEATGKVTYIPNEAQVLLGNNSGSEKPTLNITA